MLSHQEQVTASLLRNLTNQICSRLRTIRIKSIFCHCTSGNLLFMLILNLKFIQESVKLSTLQMWGENELCNLPSFFIGVCKWKSRSSVGTGNLKSNDSSLPHGRRSSWTETLVRVVWKPEVVAKVPFKVKNERMCKMKSPKVLTDGMFAAFAESMQAYLEICSMFSFTWYMESHFPVRCCWISSLKVP